jgi:hypothetical protein
MVSDWLAYTRENAAECEKSTGFSQGLGRPLSIK